MNNSWKRVTAGLLAFSMVAGTIPANVDWGGLFADSIIGAQAAKPDGAYDIAVNDENMGYAYRVYDGEAGEDGEDTLTAEAKEGYKFVKWEYTKEEEQYSSHVNPATYSHEDYCLMDNVKAIFEKDTTVAIGRSFRFSNDEESIVGDDVNGDDKFFQLNTAGGKDTISGTTKFTYLGYYYAGNRYVFNCTSGSDTVAFSVDSPDLGTPWGVQIAGGDGSADNPYTFRILMQAPKTYDAKELTEGTVLHVGDRIDFTNVTSADDYTFPSLVMNSLRGKKTTVVRLDESDDEKEDPDGAYYGLKVDGDSSGWLFNNANKDSRIAATDASDGVLVETFSKDGDTYTITLANHERKAEVTTAPVINAKAGRADGEEKNLLTTEGTADDNGTMMYAVGQSTAAIPAGAVVEDTVSSSLKTSEIKVGHIYRIDPDVGMNCKNDEGYFYTITCKDPGFGAWLDPDESLPIICQGGYNAFYVNSKSTSDETINITFVKYTDWSETAPTATEPGIYNVWYKAAATANGYGDSEPVFLGTSTVVDPTAIFVGNYFEAGDSENPGAAIYFEGDENSPSYFNTTGDPVELYGEYDLTWLGYDADAGRHEFKLSGSDDKTFYIADPDSSRPWGLQVASGDGTLDAITFRVLHHEPKEYDATDTALTEDLVLHAGDRIDATMLTAQDYLSFGGRSLSGYNKAFTLVRTDGENESPTGEYWGLRRDDGQFIRLRNSSFSFLRATAKSDGVIITSFDNRDNTDDYNINRIITLDNYENVPVVTTAPVINADAGRADGETAFDLIKNKEEVAATNGTVKYSFAKMPEGAVLEDAVSTLNLSDINVGHVYRVNPDVGLIFNNNTDDDYDIICNVDGFGGWIYSETSQSIKLPAGYNAFYVNGKSNGTLGITLVKYTDWSATAPTATLPGTYDVMYKAAPTASGYQDSYVTFLGTSTVIDPTAMFVGNYFKVGDTIDFGTGTSFVWYDDVDTDPKSLDGETTLVWDSYNSGRHEFGIKYGSSIQSCYISDTDSREPWGIQITGGAGTPQNPYTFRVLHYEPQSYTLTGATYNDRVLHVGDTITVGENSNNDGCMVIYNYGTETQTTLDIGTYELVRIDDEYNVTNTGNYYAFKSNGRIINTGIEVGTSVGLTDSVRGIERDYLYYSNLSAYYPPAVTTDPEANKLSYTGVAQALVTAGTAVNGVMQYSLADVTNGNDITVAAPAVGNVYKPTNIEGITFTNQKYITYTAGDVTETVDAYVDNQGANIFYLNNEFYIKSGMAYKSWSTSDYDAVLVTGLATSENGSENDTLVVQLVKAADFDWTTTIPAAVKIGQYTVYYRAANTTNGDTAAAKSVNVSIVDTRWTVKFTEKSDIVPADLVFTLKDTASGANDEAQLTADDLEDVIVVDNSGDKPVEKVKVAAGVTYYVYTNKEISLKDHDDVVDLQWVTKSKSPYNVAGKLYKYRYKFKTPAPVADATTGAYTASDEKVQFVTLDHAHDAAVYTYEANDSAAEKDKLYVICKGEYEQDGETTTLANKKVLAAKFNAKDKYYTGDYPDAGDIVLANEENGVADIYGATIKREDIEIFYYDKDGKTIASGELETGKKYVVKATIPVDIDGYVVTPVISAEFVYEALPLYSANVFYKELNPDYDATDASSSKYVQVEVDNPAYVSADETPNVPAKIKVDKETKLEVKHRDKMVRAYDTNGVALNNEDGTPKMIVSTIPNPAYVSAEETPDVDKTIAEQEYYVEVPDFTTYNEAEQGMPVIVLRNPSNNMEAYVVEPETIAKGHYPSNLISDAAYTITGDDKGTNAGTYKATLTAVEGKGYSDALAVDWTIAKAKLNNGDLVVAPNKNIVYDGSVTDGTDFTVSGTKYDEVKDDAEFAVKSEKFYEGLTVLPLSFESTVTCDDLVGEQYYMYNTGNYSFPEHQNDATDGGSWSRKVYINDGSGQIASRGDITLNADGSLTYNDAANKYQTVALPAGKVWRFKASRGDYSKIWNYDIDAVDLPENLELSDNKNAGDQVSKVTVSSTNYEDIVAVVNYDIAKRKATVGVDAENASMTYGDTFEDEEYISLAKSAVDNHFIYEAAKTKTENDKTVITNDSGIIAADASVIFSTAAENELQIKLDKLDENRNGKIDDDEKISFKYGDFKNNAGKYAYAWADVNENDDRFKYLENYDITFATVTTDGKFSDEFMFTVNPKPLDEVDTFRYYTFDELMDKVARANVTISAPEEVAKPDPETLPEKPAGMPLLTDNAYLGTFLPSQFPDYDPSNGSSAAYIALRAIPTDAVDYYQQVYSYGNSWYRTYQQVGASELLPKIADWYNAYGEWNIGAEEYWAYHPTNGTTKPTVSTYINTTTIGTESVEDQLNSLVAITTSSTYFDEKGYPIADQAVNYQTAIDNWKESTSTNAGLRRKFADAYDEWWTQYQRWVNLTKWNADKAAYKTYQGKLEAYYAAKMAADGTSDDVAYPFAEPTAPEVVTEPATQPADLLSTMPVLAAPTAGDFGDYGTLEGIAIDDFPSAENYKNNPDGYAQAIANWYSGNTDLDWKTDSAFLANYTAWSDDTENATDASFYKWKATYDESVASVAAYEAYLADAANYEIAHAEWVEKYNAERMALMMEYNRSLYTTYEEGTTATQMFNGTKQINPALMAAMALDGKSNEEMMWQMILGGGLTGESINSGIYFDDGEFEGKADDESDNEALMTADDFTAVTWSSYNSLPGQYKNKFKGINNYTGTATLTWEIVADNTIRVTVDVDDDTYNSYDVEENGNVEVSYERKARSVKTDNDSDVLKNLTTTDEITTFNTLKSRIEELNRCTTQEAYNSKLAEINALVTGTDNEPGAYQQLVGMVVSGKIEGFESVAPYGVLYDLSDIFDEEYFTVNFNNGIRIASVEFNEQTKKVVITTDAEYGYEDLEEDKLPEGTTTELSYYEITEDQYKAIVDGEADAKDVIAPKAASQDDIQTLVNAIALYSDAFQYLDEHSEETDPQETDMEAYSYNQNIVNESAGVIEGYINDGTFVGTVVSDDFAWEELTDFEVTGKGTYIEAVSFDKVNRKIDVTLSKAPVSLGDKAPKDAGKYIVKATTKAKGYSFNDSYDAFSIDPVQLKVTIDDDAMSKTYGQLDPTEINYEYNKNAIVGDYDDVKDEWVDEDVKLEGTIGIAPMYDEEDEIPEAERKSTAYRAAGLWKFDFSGLALTGNDVKGENGNDNYVIVDPYAEYPEMDDHYSFDDVDEAPEADFFTVERQLIKDENVSAAPVLANGETPIMGTQVTVKGEFEVAGEDGKPVVGEDGKNKVELVELTKNDFVSYSATFTSEVGTNPVQVKGIGNFAGFAEGTYEAVSADKFVKFNINESYVKVIEEKLYAHVSYSVKPVEGWVLDDDYEDCYGILYCNDGTITNASELTLEAYDNGKNPHILIRKGKTGTNLFDKGKGVVAVGYTRIKSADGKQKGVAYSEAIHGRATYINVNAPYAKVLSGDECVHVSYSIKVAAGWTTESYGILYCNDGTITDPAELTLEAYDNGNNPHIRMRDGKTGTNLQDFGYGVVAVGFNKVKDSKDNVAVVYTDDIGGNFEELNAENRV